MKLSADEYDDVKRGSYGGDVIQLEQQKAYDEHICTKWIFELACAYLMISMFGSLPDDIKCFLIF